ncbi:MAG: hypothetical protein H6Q05_2550 [Acidobacteria bacterium]|nr:hypothetical protein [Acidobacteriota bacterium]
MLYLTGLPFSLSLAYMGLAVLFSVGIGMFFGFYPAHRASKLNPVSAIGYAK